jgi:hypothetical protein
MKKAIYLLSFVFLFSLPLRAGFNISAFGGYTAANMSDFNKYMSVEIDNSLQYTIAYTDISATASKSTLSGGLDFGLDAGYTFKWGLTVAARLEYIGIFGATSNIIMPNIPGVEEDITYGATLVPLLLGVSYQLDVPDSPVTVGAGVYLGYGFSGAYVSRALTATDTVTADMQGGAFTGDFNLSAKIQPYDFLDAGVKLGYRLAYVEKMKYMDISRGSTAKDSSGEDLHFDFSGFMTAFCVTYLFK